MSFLMHNVLDGILPKSTRVQNPPDKILYFRYLLTYFISVLNFFCLFFIYFLLPLLPQPLPPRGSGSE